LSNAETRFVWCVALSSLCLSCYGGVISTSIYCSVSSNTPPADYNQFQTSNSSCDVSGGVDAVSRGTVAAGPFSINLQGFDDTDDPGLASLNEAASYNATILTDGPARDGFLSIDFTVLGDDSASGDLFVQAAFGPYQDGCVADGELNCNPTVPYNVAVVRPVTLGVPLELSLSGGATGDIDDDSFTVQLMASLSFSFFEADGTTPVGWTDITSAPEPNAAWLSLVGIAFVAIRKRFGKRGP
jgi:hypothetical protein